MKNGEFSKQGTEEGGVGRAAEARRRGRKETACGASRSVRFRSRDGDSSAVRIELGKVFWYTACLANAALESHTLLLRTLILGVRRDVHFYLEMYSSERRQAL